MSTKYSFLLSYSNRVWYVYQYPNYQQKSKKRLTWSLDSNNRQVPQETKSKMSILNKGKKLSQTRRENVRKSFVNITNKYGFERRNNILKEFYKHNIVWNKALPTGLWYKAIHYCVILRVLQCSWDKPEIKCTNYILVRTYFIPGSRT